MCNNKPCTYCPASTTISIFPNIFYPPSLILVHVFKVLRRHRSDSWKGNPKTKTTKQRHQQSHTVGKAATRLRPGSSLHKTKTLLWNLAIIKGLHLANINQFFFFFSISWRVDLYLHHLKECNPLLETIYLGCPGDLILCTLKLLHQCLKISMIRLAMTN